MNKNFDTQAELTLYRQAAQQDWPVSPEMRKRVIAKVMGVLSNSQEDETILAAANTMAKLDKLNLDKEKIYAAKVTVSPKNMSSEELFGKLSKILDNNDELRNKLVSEKYNERTRSQTALPSQ